jgi:hypothetical protein
MIIPRKDPTIPPRAHPERTRKRLAEMFIGNSPVIDISIPLNKVARGVGRKIGGKTKVKPHHARSKMTTERA